MDLNCCGKMKMNDLIFFFIIIKCMNLKNWYLMWYEVIGFKWNFLLYLVILLRMLVIKIKWGRVDDVV